jgi:arabinogalactan oligomer / maltooligosaccharide transport system permease protein
MKKSRKSALLSALFMGLGQFSNGKIVKGILYAAIELYILIFTIPYFRYSLWGLFTLGETSQHFVNGKATGDNSINLLMNGILCVILLALAVLSYVLNIVDAYKTGKLLERGYEKHINNSVKSTLDRLFPVFMLTPAFIVSVFLVIFPMLCSFAIAFTNYSSPYHIPPKNLVDWIGFENFKNIFSMEGWSDTFAGIAIWTVIWAIVSTVTVYFNGLFLALLTNSKDIKFKKFWRSIFILPMAMPGFISLLIMRLAFNGMGPINQLLGKIGVGQVNWLTDPLIAKGVLIVVNLWLSSAGFMVMMSGVLTSISKEVYEASAIDGASEGQKFRSITLPLVLYATAPLLVMNLAGNLNNFGVIYMLTDGGPVNPAYRYAGSTDILLSWVYKMTLQQNQYNMASVVSILIFIVIAVVSIFNLKRTRSFREEDLIQ